MKNSSIEIDFGSTQNTPIGHMVQHPVISVELIDDKSDWGLLLQKFFESFEGEIGEVKLLFKKRVNEHSTSIVLFPPGQG